MSEQQILALVKSNVNTIDSAIALLSDLPADLYTQIHRPYFESSLGKHLRHLLDHYLCFQRDLASGKIDYDQRHRDCQLETDKDYALKVCHSIRLFLDDQVSQYTSIKPLQVSMCNDVDIPVGELTVSSLGRELQFLQGHSVHHYALMATMLRLAGIVVNEQFGVAPSTIVHNSTVKASA